MIKAKSQQTLFDVSIEHSGHAQPVVDLAIANGISLTDDLFPGMELEEVGIYDKKTAELFGNMLHKPATGLSAEDVAICDDVEVDPKKARVFDFTFDETYE